MTATNHNHAKRATPPAGPPPGWLRMKELVQASGAPKSTILHYLKEGLLPQPVRTSPNMAYYPPEAVARIAQIRLMQSRHRLSLADIGLLLTRQEQGGDITPLLAVREAVFSKGSGPGLDLAGFAQAVGLEPGDVAKLLEIGVLRPLEPGVFDEEDLALGHVLKTLRGLGVWPGQGSFYPRLAREIVDEELALRRRVVADLEPAANAAATLELIRAARVLRSYVIDREFQHRILAGGED
ncbi:MAG: MerR family transcriptional regulator [Deltaproteobacteria bacterium]|nr:MerR family transcriptional regulator [Deltaproteobacteria bacterium]